MRTLALVMFYGYAAMLVGVGATGVVTAEWELRAVFLIPIDTYEPMTQATLLNQYRFLKAVELSCGVYLFVFRSAIFRDATHHGLFLLIVFGGVAARGLSFALDGRPAWPFFAFTGAELLTGLLVAGYVRYHDLLLMPADE